MSVISDLLVHSVTVKPSVETYDAAGAMIRSYPGSGTPYSTRVVPLSQSEQLKFAREGVTQTHSLVFDTNPHVKPWDMIVFNGRYLYVQTVSEPDEGAVGENWTWWDVGCLEETQQQP